MRCSRQIGLQDKFSQCTDRNNRTDQFQSKHTNVWNTIEFQLIYYWHNISSSSESTEQLWHGLRLGYVLCCNHTAHSTHSKVEQGTSVVICHTLWSVRWLLCRRAKFLSYHWLNLGYMLMCMTNVHVYNFVSYAFSAGWSNGTWRRCGRLMRLLSHTHIDEWHLWCEHKGKAINMFTDLSWFISHRGLTHCLFSIIDCLTLHLGKGPWRKMVWNEALRWNNAWWKSLSGMGNRYISLFVTGYLVIGTPNRFFDLQIPFGSPYNVTLHSTLT